ncbi:c-type cytochrome [Nitrosovibrio sp. Nv17]|uniref:c-type cytochrome n=1 Tax=Nitrosovibrio sp. Nv17 TaxID=1855339 RepID=UPI0009090E51|nr:c-type cytochrome [Nitrosovibrio sp. Nv17]SFW17236.1 putative copper resistance protein D [Nitrosovibrio sp. Nv17]SFW31694.1 putative copper resistance protein D [Nitrosovibrio sp. Nv17]
MIEVVATLFRWLQLASNMILVGGCVFMAIAGAWRSPWVGRLERLLPWLALMLLVGLVGILATTTAQATGEDASLWNLQAWLALIQNTRMGHIWAGRAASAILVLAIVLYIRHSASRARWHYLACTAAACLTLIVGSLASHSAAEELSVLSVLPYALHIILASVWFGALPAFLLVCFTCTGALAPGEAGASALPARPGPGASGGGAAAHAHPGPDLDLDAGDGAVARLHPVLRTREELIQAGARALQRFSVLALPVMLAVIATGILITDRMVDSAYAAMVSTWYGWLLNAKLLLLALVLVIAARARATWLPLFSQAVPGAAAGILEKALAAGRHMRRWVGLELILALFIVLLATIVSNTVPAKHAIIQDWPYGFRFSLAATWGETSVMIRVWSGVTLLLLAFGALAYGRRHGWERKRRLGIPALLAASALALALPPLAVPAYPETYRKTPVPFDTISIANGAVLFGENCTACHGPQGKGNGVLAKSFNPPPVDLLTEPHTARHTAGDFLHWLTYGIPNTGMPPFDNLTEEDRWDVVNFLHAMSRGYQARLMSPRVVPEQPQPNLGPPNFSYSAHDGTSGTLKDFRGRKNLLLVFFSWPQSRERLVQLRALAARVESADTVLLAIPEDDPDAGEIAQILNEATFPVVTQGVGDIVPSYALFRRTLNKPDLLGEGTLPAHMEFLVDRFGYLRARWIPDADGPGWENTSMLMQQIEQLNQEPEILPPPGDHVH